MASLVSTDGQAASGLSNRIARTCLLHVAGQPIGIVGATTTELRQISSPGTVGINTNLVDSIQAAVDSLLATGVNKVILLAHLQQYRNEFDLATRLRGVDIIIAGGSHAVFASPRDRLRAGDTAEAEYPTWFTSPTGEPVAVVNTGANYRYVGRLVADFSAEGLLTAVDPVSGAYPTDPQGVAATGNLPPIPAVLNVATNLGAIIGAKDGAVFGSTEVYLNGLRSFVRTEESNLGNLSADANLWWARQQDPATSLSLKNGGGIRDSIGAVAGFGGGAAYGPPLGNPAAGKLPGQVSRLDIENALRFNNGLSLLTLTAQQLRDALEWGVAAVAPGATPGQFPQIGGLWLAYNPTNPPMTYTRSPAGAIEAIAQPGSRVRTLVATRADGSLDLVVDQGQVIGDPTRTFRMVTLDFLAGGGDSYFALGQGTLRTDLIPAGTIKSFDTPGSEQWAIASYLRTIGNYREPDTNPGLDARIQNLAFRPDTVGAPQLTRLESTGAVSVHFTTLPDRHYEVLSGPSVHGPWTVLNPIPIRGTGAIALLLDSNPDPRHGIYRVRRID